MSTPHKLTSTLCLSLLLFACARDTPSTTSSVTTVPPRAAAWTQGLMTENLAVLTALPSALFGPYVSGYLAHTTGYLYHGALQGVDAQATILFGEQQQQEETLALLEDLGAAVEANVTDLMNRSPEREKTLDEYLRALEVLLKMADSKMTALKDQYDELGKERSAARKKTSNIQHVLNQNLRDKNYGEAGQQQEKLTEAEQELAEAQARQKHIQSMIDIFEDLTEIGKERLSAMQQNRSALIAGVRVVDVPGIEDIGVLRTTRKSSRARSGGGGMGSIFDPG
ncbi:hypothetical protein HZA45_03120 [Candidatus Peregrinibacteria bacterium]|nr:hypothetical protein [Candidatus Peregrinibacteria bacterium]